MSDHNNPKPTHSSASAKDAPGRDDDFLDSTQETDDFYESTDQTFGQDNSYDPLSDDLFAQGNGLWRKFSERTSLWLRFVVA